MPFEKLRAPSQSAILQLCRATFEAKLEDLGPVPIILQRLLRACPLATSYRMTDALSCGPLNHCRVWRYLTSWGQRKHDEDQQRIDILIKPLSLKLPHKYFCATGQSSSSEGTPEVSWRYPGLGGCFNVVHYRRILRPSADRAVPNLTVQSRFLDARV